MVEFKGKVLVIGLGGVARCALPLLLKHLGAPPQNFTVMDFANVTERIRYVRQTGMNFVKDRVTRENMGDLLDKYVGPGDLIVDLAWNIGCTDILQWCRDHGVMYINTSVEMWDPYEGSALRRPIERTLYHRHMTIRRLIAKWPDDGKKPTAVLDHGANPGLVSHFTKAAMEDIARKWLDDFPENCERRENIEDGLRTHSYNQLAMNLGVKVIHISERDTQITKMPKRVNQFVNTWSIEGFFEEGVAPAEMGWGTHERTLPPRAQTHASGPLNQICLAHMGCNTLVRSWVPSGESVGMVIRHGEAFSISERFTVEEDGIPIYRPTVHYAYCPCDSAISSLHELRMRSYRLQEEQRILNDDIIDGRDELGCLLMGHDYQSWWIGSLLDIHEARRLVPHQNATTLQVAASLISATQWMIQNPNKGVCLPDDLPHEEILAHAKPYLGPFISIPVDWNPLKNWDNAFERFGAPRPPEEDVWQFGTFLVRGL